jgi:hypothetical protein
MIDDWNHALATGTGPLVEGIKKYSGYEAEKSCCSLKFLMVVLLLKIMLNSTLRNFAYSAVMFSNFYITIVPLTPQNPVVTVWLFSFFAYEWFQQKFPHGSSKIEFWIPIVSVLLDLIVGITSLFVCWNYNPIGFWVWLICFPSTYLFVLWWCSRGWECKCSDCACARNAN